MLINISRMIGSSIMSLQTGRILATIGQPIINPHNLHIVAFYVEGPQLDHHPSVLFTSDIRELGSLGAIVDSSDNIMSPDGLVRLEKILNYQFTLNGLKVIDDHKHKLGLVDGYIFNSDDFMIQQIQVKPTITKRVSITRLTVHRSQIIEIDNQKMLVKAPDARAIIDQSDMNPNAVPFENPFRGRTTTAAD